MDIFGKFDRAHSLYEKWALINDYIYPVLIVVGVIIACLIVRSYFHGKRIENLEQKTHPPNDHSSSPSIAVHCQTANVLRTSSTRPRILAGTDNPSSTEQLLPPDDRTFCPECGAKVKHVHAKFCRECGGQLTASDQPAIPQPIEVAQQTASEYCTCGEANHPIRRHVVNCEHCRKPRLEILKAREKAEKRKNILKAEREKRKNIFWWIDKLAIISAIFFIVHLLGGVKSDQTFMIWILQFAIISICAFFLHIFLTD